MKYSENERIIEGIWFLALFISVLFLICIAASGEVELSGPEFVMISDGGFGDPQNNYAWSVSEFKGDLYVGTGRNIPYFVAQAMKAQGAFPENWTLSFLTTPGGSPPPPLVLPNHSPPSQADVITWSNDMRGEIWRYHEGSWSQVHQASTFVNPLSGYTYPEGIGYRAMTTFNDTCGTEALYAGVGFGFGRTLLIKSTDGTTWEQVNTSSIPSRDTRAMVSHAGKFYLGTGEGLFASGSPLADEDTWEKVADFEVASLKSFNGFLYVGTGNPIGPSKTNGFEVWRSIVESPAGPGDWVRVVSGGAGDAWNVLAATIQEYKGDLFVGSMNLPFGTGTEGVKGFDLIRLDTRDSWDLIVGNEEPKIPTDPRGPPLSGWPSGFANPFNLYAWSIEEYDGKLYLGTFDIFSFARFISEVPGGYEILMEAIASMESGDESGEFSDELEELREMSEGYMNESYIVPLIELLANNFGGADLWTSPDGVYWVPVDLNGFGDPDNYGFRTMQTTREGIVVGTANPFAGCQVWMGHPRRPLPPIADFTAIPRTGDAPLSVNFVDQSSGRLPLSYSWEFGDGSTSTEKNPVHQYLSAGSYNVTLAVTNAEGESTECKEDFVVVGAITPLQADFTSNVTSGTVPLVVQFLDASAGNPGAWSWEFHQESYYPVGEAATEQAVLSSGGDCCSNEKNPVVTYNNPGNFTVSLTVSRTNETDTITKEEYIHVDPPAPMADFGAYPRQGEAPLSVEFWENVPYSWYYDEFLWDFGDGANGTGTWVYHMYDGPGLFNVTLTVNSAYGSNTTTKTHFINVTQSIPIPDFEGNPLSGGAPLDVVFTDKSTGMVTSRWWDFGDGTTAWENVTPSVTHSYPLPGSYNVILTSGNDAGQATVTKTEYIQVNPSGAPPDARFSVSPMMGYAPMTVRFTDRSSGMPLAWHWDFGDGSTSSEQNPSHTYATAGKYVPTLTVSGSGGSDSHSSFVWVREKFVIPTFTPSPTVTVKPTIPPGPGYSPISFFAINKSFGSAPMSVQFTDMSFHAPTSWQWDFCDGHTSTIQNPINTFTEPGTYPVSLTVANSIGESTTSRRVYVR